MEGRLRDVASAVYELRGIVPNAAGLGGALHVPGAGTVLFTEKLSSKFEAQQEAALREWCAAADVGETGEAEVLEAGEYQSAWVEGSRCNDTHAMAAGIHAAHFQEAAFAGQNSAKISPKPRAIATLEVRRHPHDVCQLPDPAFRLLSFVQHRSQNRT